MSTCEVSSTSTKSNSGHENLLVRVQSPELLGHPRALVCDRRYDNDLVAQRRNPCEQTDEGLVVALSDDVEQLKVRRGSWGQWEAVRTVLGINRVEPTRYLRVTGERRGNSSDQLSDGLVGRSRYEDGVRSFAMASGLDGDDALQKRGARVRLASAR